MKEKSAPLYFILLAAISFIAACSSSKNSQQPDLVQAISFQKDSLVINGDDGDWNKPLPYKDEKAAFSYSISNDRENLYILVTSATDATIQRILRGGVTVYINTHGVKEENGAAAISFPTGNRVKKNGKMLNDRPELLQNKHLALDAVGDYDLFGFHDIKTPQNFDYGKPNPAGIELAIGLNPYNELVYEAKVPLASFLNRTELQNTSRKSLAIGLYLENIPGETGRSRSGGGGISIGGGLGFGSFGSGGGLGLSIGTGSLARIGGGNRNGAGKPNKVWKEILLARMPSNTK